jgi:AraC-like DNA-binding protein
MTDRDLGGGTPVQRAELVTRDVDVLAELVREVYFDHAASVRWVDPDQVSGVLCTATVGALTAGLVDWAGLEYTSEEEAPGCLTTVAVRRGRTGLVTRQARGQFGAGDVFMVPPTDFSVATNRNARYATVQLPAAVTDSLARELTGIPAGQLRFEAMTPVSATAGRAFTGLALMIQAQLVTSGATAVYPLVAQELTRLAAASMLETFPNTTMTFGERSGLNWVAPAAVWRAVAFIEEHAGEPITPDQVAAAAGLSSRALRAGFQRHLSITPTGYLRRIRLERAHADLAAASPETGLTVAMVARRWGWASRAQFTAAYERRFTVPPGHTLRS